MRLITGRSRVHYADHTIEPNGAVLLFTNQVIPFFWERVSDKHTGYICIFTDEFFSSFGNIKDYPVFQSVGACIVKLSADEAMQFEHWFGRLWEELQGDYTYKYDLLRNILMEIIHGAQKL